MQTISHLQIGWRLPLQTRYTLITVRIWRKQRPLCSEVCADTWKYVAKMDGSRDHPLYIVGIIYCIIRIGLHIWESVSRHLFSAECRSGAVPRMQKSKSLLLKTRSCHRFSIFKATSENSHVGFTFWHTYDLIVCVSPWYDFRRWPAGKISGISLENVSSHKVGLNFSSLPNFLLLLRWLIS